MGENFSRIVIDDSSPLFDRKGMFTREFPSDIRQLKFFAGVIMQKVPPEIRARHFLEKQISELIKNAIKHGNKNIKTKKVKVAYIFTVENARLIVEDEGEGFQEIDEWNEFYANQYQCFDDQNFDEMQKYTSFRTVRSDSEDKGCALFQAVKFWNGGVVYNSKGNCVTVLKKYPRKNHQSSF